jgi:RNase H-fold protein (predicted Holliday junction resolvase)
LTVKVDSATILPVSGKMLALDPGSHKCGWAIECPLTHSPLIGVVYIEKLDAFLQGIYRLFGVTAVVIGGGTGSSRVADAARRMLPGAELRIVDERGSTEEALKLYLQKRGGGSLRYIASLVSRPALDGYAAWVLLLRQGRN